MQYPDRRQRVFISSNIALSYTARSYLICALMAEYLFMVAYKYVQQDLEGYQME